MLCPKDLKMVTPPAETRSGAKGKTIVDNLAGKDPRAINGFLPILSESFPA